MSDKRTIIVIGAGTAAEISAHLSAQIKKYYDGEDVEVLGEVEAKERGLLPCNFARKHEIHELTAPPQTPAPFIDRHAPKNDCKKGWSKAKRHR